jgi:GNAT superfamily N-acetyltransferase
MDRNGWLDRNRRSMEGVFAAFSRASPDLFVKADGVFAVISPETPERSVFNSVVFANPGALANAYEQLAAAYAEHGCAWTVWVPEDQTGAASLLEAAGHRLDAEPRCMGLELGALAEPDVPEVEVVVGRDVRTMGMLNDLGYGYPEGTFLRGVGAEADLIVYLAHVDGEPVAAVASHDVDDDCSIWCVATHPEARGQGLSTALMQRALRDARDRGCATSTLQATQLGAPVYERVGYGDFGALQMWERRPPASV